MSEAPVPYGEHAPDGDVSDEALPRKRRETVQILLSFLGLGGRSQVEIDAANEGVTKETSSGRARIWWRSFVRGKGVAMLIGLIALTSGVVLRVYDPDELERFRLQVFDTYQRIQPRPYEDTREMLADWDNLLPGQRETLEQTPYRGREALIADWDNLTPEQRVFLETHPYLSVGVHVADLDNETLERYGQWPWPRTLVSQLIVNLYNAGAAAIVFDIVFAEPDRTSPIAVAPELERIGAAPELLEELLQLPDFDDIMANFVAQTPVVLGFSFSPNAGTVPPRTTAGISFAGTDASGRLENFTDAVVPLPALQDVASGIGSFTITADLDGVIRQVPLLQRMDGRIFPTLAIEGLRVAQGASTYILRSDDASGEISIGGALGLNTISVGHIRVPTTGDGKIWIRYSDPLDPNDERMFPIWRILEEEPPQELLDRINGSIIFIGTSAEGLKDIRQTPVSQFEPGVNVHAQVAEQIILEEFLDRPGWAFGAEVIALALVGLMLVVLLPFAGAIWSAALGTAIVAAGFYWSWIAYSDLSMLFDPVYPAVVTFLVFLLMTVTLYLQTEREKAQVRSAFGRYISPAMVERLAEDPDQLSLGGEMRELTILFADIRGFTPISERMGPQELTSFLNEFLTPMTKIIMDRQGTIDKYMGDAIMAFWNAPLDDGIHARNACLAALDMRERLVELNEIWAESDLPPVNIGIGLNTGQAVVGNFGSEARFDYSVLGDSVNLASRLEGQGKTYGVDNVIGENTRSKIQGLAGLELDLIKVKGKEIPVRIFTILGDETEERSVRFKKLEKPHAEMLRAYRAQEWDAMEAALTECRASRGDYPLEGFYALYEERLESFRIEPPPKDWDGVFTATSK